MAYKRNVEIFEEAYEKKDAKSVVSYVARDGRKRYIAGSKSPDGGGTPMPSGGMEEVTWQELKDKRDAGKLTPGALYRITDYNCTTIQENTQSAGHQFDIVLLALSEDKLAEEGWAMEHPTDIYDVTFIDGITKKCYLANEQDVDWGEGPVPVCDIIDTESLLGRPNVQKDYMTIDRENKTISFIPDSIYSTDLTEENLTYNYFQNSNLSAWKVWYCLDNDTARFAWADDSLDEDSPASIELSVGTSIYTRNENDDEQNYFAWESEGTNVYTETSTPSIGDTVYYYDHGLIDTSPSTVSVYTPAHEGTGLPNGRGVIYRLIDEWNNDVAYDFKNIQYVRKLTDGEYDAQGTDTWVYTFSFNNDGTIVDGSTGSIDNISYFNNKITRAIDLFSNVFFNAANDSFISSSCEQLSIIANGYTVKCYSCYETVIEVTDEEGGAIYINNKKVLTEE